MRSELDRLSGPSFFDIGTTKVSIEMAVHK